MALESALLDTSIQGARGLLLNVSGGKDMTLHEITEVAEAISTAAEPDATLIFGAVVNDALDDSLCVTLVATGFDSTNEDILQAQVEASMKPRPKPEPRASTSRLSVDELPVFEPRPRESRESESRFRESSYSEPRSTQRKGRFTDFGDSTAGWEKSRDTGGTPRRKRGDDDLDVPTFLR